MCEKVGLGQKLSVLRLNNLQNAVINDINCQKCRDSSTICQFFRRKIKILDFLVKIGHFLGKKIVKTLLLM